jgi:ABC-type glycerol-3-phosphate transport system substrate-binding protein
MRRRCAIGIGCALLATGVGCKRDPAPSGLGRAAELEVFSWWTGPEKQQLDVLVDAHRARRPNIQIANIGVPNKTTDPEEVLNWRMGLDRHGQPDRRIIPHPPSLMQWDLYDLKGRWLDKGVRFVPLDDLFAAEGWRGKFYDFLARDLSVDGHQLGLPVGLNRENNMVYSRSVVRALGIDEASLGSWQGLMSACEIVRRKGRTCLALTQESWVNAIAFRVAAAATMGVQKFQAFFGRRGNRDEPSVVAAFEAYKTIFDRGYAGGWDDKARAPVAEWGWHRVRKEGWGEAAREVHRGSAVFFIHGDWAAALLRSLGWSTAELGSIVAPGTEGLVLLGVDGFLVPEGSPHRDLAMDVLRTWGQAKVLADFSRIKGDTPPRVDVDVSADPLQAAVARDLKGRSIVMTPPIFLPADTELLGYLAGTRTRDEAVKALRAALYPPTPR